MDVQFGLDTFGDVTVGPDGRPLTHAEVLRNTVDQIVLADQVGVDAIGVGEHHRDDFAVSAPEIVLAAAAGRTERILLGTAVTVLSSDDPVRLFEKFATLDGVSNGRAEVQLGRGSFTESFPLFGFDLADYEALFEEKLDLFTALLDEKPVSWSGTTRAPLQQADVFPKTGSGRLRTWIGVGGSPESVVRAARHGHPLMLAIIGGEPARFAPFVDLYHRALAQFGRETLPVGVHSPGHIGATDAEAREALFPHFKANRDRIGRERGWGPATREQFESEADHGALFVGSSETVAQKIAHT
ncbi:MAG: LLM class flavin-dependent oxidoreductase, partial [Myxococcales bacterium]